MIDELTVPLRDDRWYPASRAGHRHSGAGAACQVERKVATILFTDIKDSMELERSVELENWWSVISWLFDVMSENIYRCGGWIGNFTGDGIEAVFEDNGVGAGHAERACDAALALREAIKVPAQQVLREQGRELALRIGINSGNVLTGTIGAGESGYYTATGYTVSLAKRIEGLALPDTICMSDATAALLGAELELHDLGVFDVKGAELPVGVYELLRRR